MGRLLVVSGLLAMLVAYGAKTYTRNWDWLSEEVLFLSAQKVCVDALVPGSVARWK
jgi:hypothetical protein